MERPAEARRAPDDMHDAPEELEAGHPLRDALLLCRDALVACHDGAAARAAEIGRRRAALGLWAAISAAVAAVLALAGLAASAAGKMPDGAGRPLAVGEAAAAAACLLLLAARSLVAGRSAWLAESARVERSRAAKFRFLLDPSLWSRRGQEAQERSAQFRTEAEIIAAPGPGGAVEWISADTIPVVRTIPVGSGIDPHTVHTLMDYYQTTRIDPQLERLGREAASRKGFSAFASSGTILAASAACILAASALFAVRRAGAPVISPGLSAALVAVAAALPFLGAVMTVALSRSASDRARRRAQARQKALSDLSARLQKVSGAEAIFRELGFCEDVLETEGRERLRAAAEGGWLG